jgi:hypothetical protein
MAERLGALGGIGKEDFQTLSRGLQASNNPITNVFGYDVTPEKALTTAVGYVAPALSAPLAIGGMISDYNINQLANKSLNRPTDFMSGFNKQSLTDLRSVVDADKDKNITDREVQNFGMNRGLTAYNVGLNPMQGYKRGSVVKQDITNVDPTGLGVNTGAVGSSGNLNKTYGSNVFSGLFGDEGFQKGEEIKVDPTKGKDLSRTFADDAGSVGDKGTYICTALYEMGEMKKYIYKYDQVYGKRVDPNVYRGYCLWGKYVATKLRYKGFTYKIVKPLALSWAKQMAFDLSKGKHGKKSRVVKVISKIGEGICYALGLVANIKIKKGVRYG